LTYVGFVQCPYCPSLFVDKAELEKHLSGKAESKYHPPCSKGDYNNCEKCLHPKKQLCKRDVYFCRDDLTCLKYSLFNYHCCHGGGPACNLWRRKTNQIIETGGV
jgi:hypothetical protein